MLVTNPTKEQSAEKQPSTACTTLIQPTAVLFMQGQSCALAALWSGHTNSCTHLHKALIVPDRQVGCGSYTTTLLGGVSGCMQGGSRGQQREVTYSKKQRKQWEDGGERRRVRHTPEVVRVQAHSKLS